jgi:hypothetical protein
MSPTPQSKVSEISGKRSRIIDDFVRDLQLNALACQRLENELRELIRLPEFECNARIELAMLQAMKRRWPDVVSGFNRVRQLGFDLNLARRFEAVAALYCGRPVDAFELISGIVLSGDPEELRAVRSAAMQSGHYDLAAACTDRMFSLNLNPDGGLSVDNLQGIYHDVYAAQEVVRQSGLSSADIAARIGVASSIVCKRSDAPLVVYGFSATVDAGILYEFPLRLGIDDLIAIEWEISEALVDSFPDYESGIISFTTKPYCPVIASVA